jgi:diaminopimelate epimerase
MSGSGNDFIIIDNREKQVNQADISSFVTRVCRRAMSVGADGFILVEDSDSVDFRWRFFNSDGSLAEMCGNGARCVARFAFLNRIAGPELQFETDAGIVSAHVAGDSVRLKMTDPEELEPGYSLTVGNGEIQVGSVNTGVPHTVIAVAQLDDVDVVRLGREIRHHERYAPAGTNVNFVSVISDGQLALRTYERGVEDETLACGTGAVASAIVMASLKGFSSPIVIKTRSGQYLKVYFEIVDGRFRHVHLEGDARIVYRGELLEEAWNYD